MKANKEKDKKGAGDKAGVSELNPWPSYIEVHFINCIKFQ
jgi:hypothetical protein